MSLIPDIAALQKTFDALALATFQAGETVLAAGSRTGQLLILKKGSRDRQGWHPARQGSGARRGVR